MFLIFFLQFFLPWNEVNMTLRRLLCHCWVIYGRLPPKMPVLAPGSDTHQKIYWVIWELPGPQSRGEIILSLSLLTAAGEAFFGLWPHVETTKEAVGGPLWSAAFRPSEPDVVFPQHPGKKNKTKTFLFWNWCVTVVALFLLSIPSTAFWFHWNTCQFLFIYFFKMSSTSMLLKCLWSFLTPWQHVRSHF